MSKSLMAYSPLELQQASDNLRYLLQAFAISKVIIQRMKKVELFDSLKEDRRCLLSRIDSDFPADVDRLSFRKRLTWEKIVNMSKDAADVLILDMGKRNHLMIHCPHCNEATHGEVALELEKLHCAESSFDSNRVDVGLHVRCIKCQRVVMTAKCSLD